MKKVFFVLFFLACLHHGWGQWSTREELDEGIMVALHDYDVLHSIAFTNRLEQFREISNSSEAKALAELMINVAMYEYVESGAREAARVRAFHTFTNIVQSSSHFSEQWPQWLLACLYVSDIERSGSVGDRTVTYELCTNLVSNLAQNPVLDPLDPVEQAVKHFYGTSDFSLMENIKLVTASLACQIGEYESASNLVSSLPESIKQMVLE